MHLPPEVDDAISPRSPLHPPRKSFAFALRTAAVPPGRCIGTRKCRNVKPLRLRDTALATLIRYLLRLRFCTPLPLCYTLFQRLALLSDTSLVQSAFRQRLLAPFFTTSKRYTIFAFFPQCGALALFALRQSGFVANGTRRLTFFASHYTADNGTAVRAMIGRVRNRRLCQLPDLYASATPHSLHSTVSAPSPGPGAANAFSHTPSGKPLRNRPMLQLPCAAVRSLRSPHKHSRQ